MKSLNRRNFIKSTALSSAALSSAALSSGVISLAQAPTFASSVNQEVAGKVGIIGLDTSHSVAFTKVLNDTNAEADVAGCTVVAAYPHGSKDIESSVSRIPKYTEEIQELGVKIVDSIDALLDEVDFVLLETNDGRRHLEQALPVFEAGKPVFIDKPISASLSDAVALFNAAEKYDVPMFSSSSLRYMRSAQEVVNGSIGKVLGATAYSPAHLEPTHPDLYWYGVHGVEALFTVMGTGCQSVTRQHSEGTDVVVGSWNEGRIGTFRGMRSGELGYGGIAFGKTGIAPLGPYDGNRPLLVEIVKFFKTGQPPVSAEETLEIFAFMTAADVSKQRGGQSVTLEEVMTEAREKAEL
ncbi:MAG: Gfo/Idh/MocA family protein [Cyclobacteriaceae bacterium]